MTDLASRLLFTSESATSIHNLLPSKHLNTLKESLSNTVKQLQYKLKAHKEKGVNIHKYNMYVYMHENTRA